MKTKAILLGTFSLCLLSSSVFAQERKEVEKEVKSVKKEIRKEVRMEEENGVTTLTISTDDNGVKTEEVYVGAEAEAKLAEIMPQMEVTSEVEERVEESVEIRVDDQSKERQVVIRKSVNGEEIIEVYEGEEADAKIKEIEREAGIEMTEEKVVVQKKAKRSQAKKIEEVDIKE